MSNLASGKFNTFSESTGSLECDLYNHSNNPNSIRCIRRSHTGAVGRVLLLRPTLLSFLANSRLKSEAKTLNDPKRRDRSLCYITTGGKTCNKRKLEENQTLQRSEKQFQFRPTKTVFFKKKKKRIGYLWLSAISLVLGEGQRNW